MNRTFTFTTEHIVLRAPEPEDLEVMYRIENNPEVWMVSNTTVPYSRYVLKKYISNCTNDIYQDHEIRLMIHHRESNVVVGMIDLIDFSPLHGRAEIGMVILDEYRRKGLGREALSLLCDYAFSRLHLHQLYAYIAADNTASLALFADGGFQEGARLKQWINFGTEYQDVCVMQRFTSSCS